MNKVELLAPVGSFDALVGAVQNGADAVYLGGKKFGARQYANNFHENGLIKAVEYCHIRGVKIYVTVNTLVSDKELKDFIEYIGFLYNIDVDAVIIQDLGVLKCIRENFPDFEVHASTQMTIHNLEGVKLLESLGVSRAVMAREMDIDSIEYIRKRSPMELEVFVHGALCICYSGQCLMSSLIGGRSGNRGRCAQPCRLPYSLVDLETKEEINTSGDNYILSPRDLNTLEDIGKLLNIGVHSLKIEGRMKRPEYVAVVVRAYRNAIDMYYREGKIRIDSETESDLKGIFNRKFTKGHLLGEKGKNLMNFEKPGNMGMEIGEVLAFDKGKKRIRIRLKDNLQKGDGIEIRNRKREYMGVKVGKMIKDNKIVEKAFKDEVIEMDFKGRGVKGDKVFKTSNVSLLSRALETYRLEGNIVPISGAVKCKLGEEIQLYVWDSSGNYISTEGKEKIQKALNRPLDEDRIEKQLNKLGNTPYYFEKIEIDIDEGIAMPISEINNIRREAIEKLNTLRAKVNKREKFHSKPLKLKESFSREKIEDTIISAYVNNLDQLKTILNTEINRIYYSNINNIEKALDLASKYKKLLIPALSRITYDKELELIQEKRDILIKNGHVLLSNHGQLNMFMDDDINIYGDFSFNIFNSLTAKKLQELNVSNFTLSPELNNNQIKELASQIHGCELIVYGHLPMMITKYCPVKVVGAKSYKNPCRLCEDRKFGLKDRYGIIFPLQKQGECRTQLLNSKKMFLLEYMEEIIRNNISIVRLQFTNEDKNEIISIVKAYCKALDRIQKGKKGLDKEAIGIIKRYKDGGDYTKGHFLRGVD